jgi:hypothetical protein
VFSKPARQQCLPKKIKHGNINEGIKSFLVAKEETTLSPSLYEYQF